MAACAAAISAPGAAVSNPANGVTVQPASAPGSGNSVITTSTSGATTVAIALAYAGPLANTSPGVVTPRMWRSLP